MNRLAAYRKFGKFDHIDIRFYHTEGDGILRVAADPTIYHDIISTLKWPDYLPYVFDILDPTWEEMNTLLDMAYTNTVTYPNNYELVTITNCDYFDMQVIMTYFEEKTKEGIDVDRIELVNRLHPYRHKEEKDMPTATVCINKTLRPTNVIFNNPATIVFWNDGTKTVVKCSANDIFTKEGGFAAALAKKMYGPGKLKKILKSAVDQKEETNG